MPKHASEDQVTTLTSGIGGKAASVHTHSSTDVTDFTTAVDTRIATVIDSAPVALDTLNELAAALGDDANFASTVTTSLAGKAATSHSHTAANVTDFDTEVSNNTDVAANIAARHTHANKALLDTYTQTEVNLADAVTKKHAHSNSAVLDATTASFLLADETKLDGIAAAAEVNVNADWNSISGDSQILNKPTTMTPTAHTHPVSDMTATGTRDSTTYLRGDNTWATPAGGSGTNLTATLSATNTVIVSDTGTDATIPTVDGTNAGVMTPTMKTKLDGIESGAQVNTVTPTNTVAFTNKIVSFSAGTASAGTAPAKYTSGTLLTTAEAGASEYLTNTFYATPNASNRAVAVSSHYTVLDADFTGTNATGAQPVFSSLQDTITLPASTAYEMEGFYHIHTTGTTSHALQIAFGGTATITNIDYGVMTSNIATESFGAIQAIWRTAVTLTSVVSAIATASHHTVTIKGIVRINAAGTFIPQYGWSGAPGVAGVTLRGSYFKLTPIGTNTMTTVGNWS